MKKKLMILLAAAFAMLAPAAFAQEFDVDGSKDWLDTGIDLKAGETVRFYGSGTIKYSMAPKENGPEGGARGWTDMLRTYPLNDAPKGALIGRIGDRETSRPFLIAAQREHRVGLDGRLYVGINQVSGERPTGSFKFRVERANGVTTTTSSSSSTASSPSSSNSSAESALAAAAAVAGITASPTTTPPATAAVTTPSSPAPAVATPIQRVIKTRITQQQLDAIPPRVVDKDNNPGDRVNFIVVGSENQLKNALASAGWVTVDRSAKDAIFRGILMSVSKQAYVTLPMSELMMFGRVQDYGYAQGDPLRVIASRHHFRVWKAPFQAGGQNVWVGAGTHDIGFDKDQRNGKITHKIDPDTDKEREFIAGTINESGMLAGTEYMTMTNPVKEAKTAHGEAFSSDGRTAVMYFAPDTLDTSDHFADYFCTVLAKNNPDTGDWGGCNKYIEDTGKTDFQLPELSKNYRVLIIPGFMSSCFPDSPAFMEGQEALKNKYGVPVDLLAVPNDSSDDNAKMIGDYLRENGAKDSRKYIVVGYSKGAPDLQVTLAKQNITQYVAAFISVAGASGGSVVADALPGMADQWIRSYFKLGNCKGDLTNGFKSLKRSERQAFLGAYPNSPVPTYSIIAFSEKAGTSKALVQTWDLLAAYDKRQDGQLTQADAILPNSTYLGALKGDHFAVALPFDKAKDATIRNGMDKTRFPRAAVLESLLRFVMHDLASKQ